MKNLTQYLAALLLLLFVGTASATTVDPRPNDSDDVVVVDPTVNWKAYSRALVDGIRSDNEGIRHAAIRLAIQYADSIDIGDGAIELMRIYRNADDAHMRQMAAVALASMHSRMADGYLRMNVPFERNETVRRTLKALVNN